MATTTSIISQSPYFDDFDPQKDYVQVLFRPGFPVQARELTTLQSFFREQISRFGGDFFSEGTVIRAAEVDLATDAFQITLTGTGSTDFPASGALSSAVSSPISGFINKTISNEDGSVKAIVLDSPLGVDESLNVGNIYIKYITEGSFDSEGGYLYSFASDNDGQNGDFYTTYSATSVAAIASINDGVFYVNGRFATVTKQSIVVSTTTQFPTFKVGLEVEETIVTQNEDTTLFDNARGSTNDGAPGAHRLKFTLTLADRDIDAPADPSFYLIATYINGIRQETPEIDIYLQGILDILARRTYDESGHYALEPFTPAFSQADSDGVFAITLAPSKAYVKGYEIEKNAPTRISLDRQSGSQIVRNKKTPVVGPTFVKVTGVSGTLPGSTGGDPFTSANRVQLRNTFNEVIGVARGYAVLDEFENGIPFTGLYLYDIRMFNVLRIDDSDFRTSLLTGYDVVNGRTRGYVYTDEGAAGISNGITIIASTGEFVSGTTISSTTTGTQSTINAVTPYTVSDVTDITASNGFAATVTAGTFENSNSSLFVETSGWIKTLKDDAASIIDNDYDVIENTGSGTVNLNAANGFYDKTTLNDGVEITKTLKFAYLKVRSDSSANYGWSPAHKEISLHYPDIYRVYQVNQSTANNFDTGRFNRIGIATSGVIPQGAIVTGETSGAKAIVALSNAVNTNETSLASGEFHKTITATGSVSSIEVIFTRGLSFITGESLTVETTAAQPDYTFSVEVTSSTAPTGADITSSFQLDDGQRNEYYDIGRLVRKESAPSPSRDIIVFFSYWDATPSTNHFYSVDSYSEDLFKFDPRYFGETRDILPFTGGRGSQLRNGFDFRLRVQPVTDINNSPFNFASRQYFTQDRILPKSVFTADQDLYLSRIDLVSLEKTGEFVLISGVPSFDPKRPKKSENGMAILYALMNPIVRYPEFDVKIEKLDNRRYTMRDIGELESRIDSLEKQVSLSFLEIQALNDDLDGRTRSGFAVDSFNTEEDSPADTTHPEWFAEIDIIDNQLVPFRDQGRNISMTVTSKTSVSDFFSGYILKDFTEEAFSTQLDATSPQRINPFATWIFNGKVTLNPAEYNWAVRRDNYFTSLFGELRPFEGNAADFANFNRITTRSPGGRSTTVNQWIGRPWTTTNSTNNENTFFNGNGVINTFRAQRSTTTVTFDKPRSTGEVTTSLAERRLVRNTDDYWMPAVTISYSVENLKPNVTHNIYFGESLVGTVTSNANGAASGSFAVPAQTYKVGTEIVRFEDQATTKSSFGNAPFTSIGHLSVFNNVAETATERVTTSTRNVLIGSRTPRPFLVENGDDGGDPIAQMFKLPTTIGNNAESSIVTSLDLWFAFVDDRPNMNRAFVEIVESLNGYPTSNVLTSSDFVYLAKSNETTSITDASAVNFKFTKPVVLRDGIEYSIVIKSPSDLMEVYVAEIGETLIDGSGIHSSQPNVGGYFGSFFSSQNATTWNAEQSKDLTYRLYRAKFVENDATITAVNTIADNEWFQGDIGAFSNGLAVETFKNCNYVKITHPNHGFHYDGAQVKITVDPLQIVLDSESTINGITPANLNGTFTVFYPTLDSYFIRLNEFANNDGFINVGRFTAFATQDIAYDSITTNLLATKEETDEIGLQLQTTIGSSLNMIIDPGNNNRWANAAISTPVADSLSTYEPDEIIEFDQPRLIRSQTNAPGNDLTMIVTLSSASEYTSPILREGSNLEPIVFRNHTGNFLVDSDINLSTTLTTTSPNDSDDDQTQEFVARISGIQSETEHSAYVTKAIELEIPADGFTISFDADMEPGSRIDLAYKVRGIGDDTPFEDLEWTDFDTSVQVNEENYGNFSSDPRFVAYKIVEPVALDFTSFKIRLRMRTENEALIPKIRNLRIVADV